MSEHIYSLLGIFSFGAFAAGTLLGVAVSRRSGGPIALHELNGGDDDSESEDEGERVRDEWGVLDAPYKMLLCVNMELKDENGKATKMKPGKMAAQCCHACLGAYRAASKRAPSAVRAWALTGQAKVCVKVPTEEELEKLRLILKEHGIPYYLVEDAGRTQVAPGSRTVLAAGPAPVKILDQFTSHLKLY
mmetsp:Transcript_4270/g.6035  ORF Transcript_4270/g.6035 Transcript_4270/m.6035 type:complete len:190 (+) Transcript_4270:174-743(+)